MFELAFLGFILLGGYMLAATVFQLIYAGLIVLSIPFVAAYKKIQETTEGAN